MRQLWIITSLLVLSACESTDTTREPVSAVLVAPDAAVQAELKERVSEALGTETFLSSSALTESHVLIVERRPYQQLDNQGVGERIVDRPDHFELYRQGEDCLLRHRQSEREWVLQHARCQPVAE